MVTSCEYLWPVACRMRFTTPTGISTEPCVFCPHLELRRPQALPQLLLFKSILKEGLHPLSSRLSLFCPFVTEFPRNVVMFLEELFCPILLWELSQLIDGVSSLRLCQVQNDKGLSMFEGTLVSPLKVAGLHCGT